MKCGAAISVSERVVSLTEHDDGWDRYDNRYRHNDSDACKPGGILMSVTASVKVSYRFGEGTIEGIDEFSEELTKHYVANVRGRRAGLGGGLYQLSVEFLSRLTFKEIATFLLEGLAYDLIKTAGKEFVIRPFLDAYSRLKERPTNTRLGIDEVRFTFQDTSILIRELPNTELLSDLEGILISIAQNLPMIAGSSKDRVFEIRIPIVEDDTPERIGRFRDLTWVDEPIDVARISSLDYFRYWGIEYDIEPRKAYDVGAEAFIDERYYTTMEYWALQRAERDKKRSGLR